MANKAIEDALKSYNENYYKKSIKKEIIDDFGNKLLEYTKKINNAYSNDENEEHFKNIVNSFLKDNFYQDSHYSINTLGYIDSAIRYDNKPLVLIEAKKYNNKNEMVKVDNINRKALHEIFYYYLESSRDYSGNRVILKSDVEIRRAIITDTVNWFIFDANNIEKICTGYLEQQYYKYKNNQLAFSNDTSKFYNLIAEYFEKIDITNKLDYICFNLKDLYKNRSEWKNIYKIFSNYYLLKDTYTIQTTTHKLNNKFYQELLYIMGLKEKKNKTKLLIEIDHSIKNSLADQVYHKYIDDKEIEEKNAINKTFELIIIWINRLLFIKLFENQLTAFNSKDEKYTILSNEKIKSFDDLQNLFFNVLGKKIEDRDENEFYNRFTEIPYLNSSLFERQEIEAMDININEIKNLPLKRSNGSVLNNHLSEINLLNYMIDFLNSYNFGIDLNDDGTYTKGKDIIDASVLGLIFEKINGYKDGAFFTPSVITEYMCKKTLENLIIEKINEKYKWSCKKLEDIHFKIQNKGDLQLAKDINNLINSVKICDPAVGSGHFLVSALNRLIAIKAELGVLFEYNTNNLLNNYDIFVSDDILNIRNAQGDDFIYNQFDINSQKVQETLFNEKRIIIENCLFGVDINPKAVSICQLRLWIELLKNAYYKNHIMETLPNIDINIKVGNSLVHKLDFSIGKKLSNNIEVSKKILKEYKEKVKSYKSTSDKAEKKEVKIAINKLKSALYDDFAQISLFDTETNNAINDMDLYKGAFEWTFEFPEIINEDGEFLGFDAIIGNPPYGADLSEIEKRYCKDKYCDVHMRTPDTYIYFISLGEKLLKKNSPLSYITPNNLLYQNECEKTRKLFLDKNIIEDIINLGDNAFEDASVPTGIFRVKNINKDEYSFEYRDYREIPLNEINWETHKVKNLTKKEMLMIPSYVFGIDSANLNIMKKIQDNSLRISDIEKEVAAGISTGCNDAFRVNVQFAKDNNFETELLKPLLIGENINKYNLNYSDLLIIYSTKKSNTNNQVNIIQHINQYREKLEKRRETKNGSIPYWALHWPRNPELFENNKILIRQTSDSIIAAYDKSNYYALNSLLIFQRNEECEYSYEFILGILNSRLTNYVYKNLTQESGRAFSEVKPINVKKLFIPKMNKEQQSVIENLVVKIINNKKDNLNYDSSDEEGKIDEIIYNFYKLEPNEIKIVQSI